MDGCRQGHLDQELWADSLRSFQGDITVQSAEPRIFHLGRLVHLRYA